MIPAFCIIKQGETTNGDCVRACIASILELDTAEVPHFFERLDDESAQKKMHEWLYQQGWAASFQGLPMGWSKEQLLNYMQRCYPNHYYMLWAQTIRGDHCVVGKGAEIVHDPAWARTPIIEPHSSGYWIIGLMVTWAECQQ